MPGFFVYVEANVKNPPWGQDVGCKDRHVGRRGKTRDAGGVHKGEKDKPRVLSRKWVAQDFSRGGRQEAWVNRVCLGKRRGYQEQGGGGCSVAKGQRRSLNPSSCSPNEYYSVFEKFHFRSKMYLRGYEVYIFNYTAWVPTICRRERKTSGERKTEKEQNKRSRKAAGKSSAVGEAGQDRPNPRWEYRGACEPQVNLAPSLTK